MSNILDYLRWRGDLLFENEVFNDVDALILSRLSYMPFEGIIPEDFVHGSVSLYEAASRCIELSDTGTRTFRIKDDRELLCALLSSRRFSTLELAGHVNTLDNYREEQFSATTILLSDSDIFVAFRGTDGTLVGWKEDFNMGFASVVPSQTDAVAYLETAASYYSGHIRVGGHSKGGNLAVYSSAFCRDDVQDRIISVRSNDGPGFLSETLDKSGFRRIIDRVKTFLPQSSVIGMLLEHEEDFDVIHSTNAGLMQHDVYSWEIFRNGFVNVSERTNSSHLVDMTLKNWMLGMPPMLREKMIDGVFKILSASEGTTIRDLLNGRNMVAVIKAVSDMDDETKDLLKHAYELLKGSLKKSIPAVLDKNVQEGSAIAELISWKPDLKYLTQGRYHIRNKSSSDT